MDQAKRRCGFSLGGELSDDERARVMVEYEGIVLEEVRKLKESVNNYLCSYLRDETKELVGQILAVFSMSHLFTTNIVNGFNNVVRKMCSILEVNMENIRKAGLSEEQVKNLLGDFDRIKAAERAANIERERRIAAEKRGNAIRRRARDVLQEEIDRGRLSPEILRRIGVGESSSSTSSAISTPSAPLRLLPNGISFF